MSDDRPGSDVGDQRGSEGPHAIYQSLLERGVLAFQACAQCSAAVFPPRGRCSRCGADALVWRASGGRGAVYSATVLAPKGQPAYTVVLVDLDEGFRMMSRVDGQSVAIDDRVEAVVSRDGGTALPLFTANGGVR